MALLPAQAPVCSVILAAARTVALVTREGLGQAEGTAGGSHPLGHPRHDAGFSAPPASTTGRPRGHARVPSLLLGARVTEDAVGSCPLPQPGPGTLRPCL